MKRKKSGADVEAILGEGFSKEGAEQLRAWVEGRQHLFERPESVPLNDWSGKPPHVPSAVEQLRRDGLPTWCREELEAAYGFENWRLAVCLVINHKDGKAERAELAEWLVGAVQREDGDELRAFAKCLDALRDGKQGSRAKNARALALHFCRKHFEQTGRTPSQAWVRRYLVKYGFPELKCTDSTMRRNEARDIFFGPILGSLRKAKGGRPETSVKIRLTVK